MEFNSEELGNEIKKLRKKLKMTQKELANKICSQTTISYIEQGKTYPSIDILYYISLKLGVTMDYFFAKVKEENELYKTITMQTIKEFVKRKKYDEVYNVTKVERRERKNRNLGDSFNKFIDLHFFRSAQIKGQITCEECVEELKNLIGKKSNTRSLMQELEVKNIIANVLADNNKEHEAIVLLNEILNHDVPLLEYNRLKLKVYYNLANIYVQLENYSSAVKLARDGVKLSLELEDISMLGNLYFQLGISLYYIHNDFKEAQEYINKSKFYFNELKRDWSIVIVDDFINKA